MSEQAAQEPTMEEILASIRRIISEDDAPAAEDPAPAAEAAPAPAPIAAAPAPVEIVEEEDDVLDLTHPMDPPEEAATPVAAAPEPQDDVETLGDLDAYIAPAKPAVTATPIPAPAPRAAPLLTERAAASVASSFGQLSSALAMPAAGRTLEDVTRELLRPLIKEWLDANLPRIVEAKVAEEVERLARQYR